MSDDMKDDVLVPPVCYLADLHRILGISFSQIHALRQAGVFPIAELPRLDRRPRWSGEAVRRYISGDTRLSVVPSHRKRA